MIMRWEMHEWKAHQHTNRPVDKQALLQIVTKITLEHYLCIKQCN